MLTTDLIILRMPSTSLGKHSASVSGVHSLGNSACKYLLNEIGREGLNIERVDKSGHEWEGVGRSGSACKHGVSMSSESRQEWA